VIEKKMDKGDQQRGLEKRKKREVQRATNREDRKS
jgi:hypothetical protein